MMPETDNNAPETITAESVTEWLKRHPDFFRLNPEILDTMEPPEQRQGRKVADFQYYMARRAREDRDDILNEAREIVETSRANMNNQARIHEAILRLTEARSFDEFVQTITMDLATMLDVDIIALIVETDGHDVPHIHTSGVRVIPVGSIDHLMEGRPVKLEANTSGIEGIFGGGAGLVASQALVRIDISMQTPPAMLAFGSRDPQMFEAGQATDQVQFLARIVERMFRLWLDLPG
ncbi:MAG: DUF484 family protein [Rhodospirillales bacterium]|nr:DUF484 family protein [Rhodospirillales bacterium]